MNESRNNLPAIIRYTRSIVVLCICLLVAGCGKQTRLSEDVRALTLKTLSGEQIALADVTGPVLINFWATDCVVCVKEMPELVSLYQRNVAQGFNIVAVAMPYDPPNLVLSMAESEQWPFPVALDVSGEALAAFATVKGTPTSYLLDKHGQLVKRYVGAIPVSKLQKQIDSLVNL